MNTQSIARALAAKLSEELIDLTQREGKTRAELRRESELRELGKLLILRENLKQKTWRLKCD